MANLSGFNANEVPPNEEFKPLPAGRYLAILADSEDADTKSGGRMLKLTFEIVEGEYKGRKLWSRLNLVNASDDAVRIARGELSSLCRAVGVMTPRDSCELHNIPLLLTVAVAKRKDTGALVNEIKKYERRASAQETCPAASATEAAPWMRPG